jgi:hypothetical protein
VQPGDSLPGDVAWSVLVPYHLMRRRGLKRATLRTSTFLGCFIAGTVVAMVMFAALTAVE